MIWNRACIVAYLVKFLKAASFAVFLVASFIIVYGLLSKPYGLEGIYYRCAHLEPPHSDQGNPVGTLFGVPLRRAGKAETLGTLFSTWSISGLILAAFWLRGRKMLKEGG